MKKQLFISMFLLFSMGALAQTNSFPQDGNVGIGTTNPQNKLDVNGDIQISNASIPMGLLTEVGGTTPLLNMSVNFRETNKNTTYPGGAFRIDTRDFLNTTYFPLFQWLNRNAGTTTESVLMSLTKDGNLGIGTFIPQEKLSVNGNIRAKEVKVENANWPDYVFSGEYKQTSLSDLKKYIEQNQHLPDIPSAAEVKTNGIDLGKMNAKLLQKIEELTLHLINMDEKLTSVIQENKELKQAIKKRK